MIQWHDTWSWYWSVPTLLLWVALLVALVHASRRFGVYGSARR